MVSKSKNSKTKSSKRKRSDTPPVEDLSDSDVSSPPELKSKRRYKKKRKIVESSSSESEDDVEYDDVDSDGNIKNLISPSSDEETETYDECTCEKELPEFLESLFGNKKSNKIDTIAKSINNSTMSQSIKNSLLKKLNNFSHLEPKQEEWFEYILSIPFGKYSPPPIDILNDDVSKYFTNVMDTLNKTVYGLSTVKEEIINYLAQTLTTKNPSPRILALQGSMGIGKTRIIRDGIAKVLNTPMQTFSMGGIKDSSHFVGFDFTYQGSKHGSVIQALIDSKVMNPIIFLDELDKISDCNDGEEVKNLLIHMTDPIQNHEFKDKYFDGINIDLSKVIFIFAFNDITRINPVLLDRLHIIKIEDPSDSDKLIISNNYVIDELLKNITLTRNDFVITNGALMEIIKKYSNRDSGIRSVKNCIQTILLKINTLKLLGKSTIDKIGLSFNIKQNGDKNYTFPIVIDEKNISVFLEEKTNGEDEPYKSMFM